MSAVTPGLGTLGAEEVIGQRPPGDLGPAVGARRRGRPRVWRVTIFVLAALFFLVPLVSAFKFSLLQGNGHYGFGNYGQIISDGEVRASLITSLEISAIAAVFVILLMLPTVVWIRLRRPGLTPVMEVVTLLPIVLPPVVIAAGLEELQTSAPQWMINLVFNHALTGLTPFYVILAMPFTYRALDIGVRTIDLRTLVDASRNLGASWTQTLLRVILPNVESAVLGAMFLAIALCLGEVVIATFLLYKTLPTEMVVLEHASQLGVSVALSMITLAFTFLLLFGLSLLARRRRGTNAVRVI